MRARRAAQLSAALLVVAAASDASATYSILGVDLERGAVGGAVASCVPLDVLLRVYGAVPGRGALVTQSYLHPTAHDLGLSLLEAGAAPDQVLAGMVDPTFDPDFEKRQYAVLDLEGSHAAFSGAEALPWAGGAASESQGFVFSAQGNILTGAAVVELALAPHDACDLPEHLLRALEAPGAAGLGDSRCTPYGIPARSAVLFVDPPEAPAGSFLALAVEVPDPTMGPSEDPVAALRGLFDVWREAHPCALPVAARRDEPASESCACTAAGPRGSGGSALSLLLGLALVVRRRR